MEDVEKTLRSLLNSIHNAIKLLRELPDYSCDLEETLQRAYNLTEEQLKDVVWATYLENNPIEGS